MKKPVKPNTIKDRRHIHENPECGMVLPKTKEYVIGRLKEMNLINDEEYNNFKPSIIKNAIKLGYDTKLYKSTEEDGVMIYSNYAELAEELLESELISIGKYEELLLEGGYEDILYGDINEEDNISYDEL